MLSYANLCTAQYNYFAQIDSSLLRAYLACRSIRVVLSADTAYVKEYLIFLFVMFQDQSSWRSTLEFLTPPSWHLT